MQILVWILLPVFLFALALTVFFHYRKKKKGNRMDEDAENDFILAVPEQFTHKKVDGDYVFFDHSGLIREYKNRMFYNHARYAALRNDYKTLEAKYSSLAITGIQSKVLINTKKIYMKNYNEQVLAVTTDLPEDLVDKKELTDKLEQLSRSYQRLEEENRFLQEQISLQTAGDDESAMIINRWKDENQILRDKVAEQEYLEELLEEKKAQIVFLQNQLEQRIRNQHQVDQQRLVATTEMQQAQELQHSILQQLDALKNEVALKQDETDQLQMILCEKEKQLAERQQAVGSKLDHITWLENTLREVKEQNEMLNAELADKKDELRTRHEQLSDERSRLLSAEQKLQANKQMLHRLYREFSSCVNEEVHESPIVTLRSSYMNKLNAEEWDETAVH